jgi:tetratricopeptide (TPR) repeat protein
VEFQNVILIDKQPEELRENKQELEFLQAVARRLPEDTDVMRVLGDLYTRTGAYADGLRVDERLSRLCAEDPVVWYNLACSLALSNRSDDAFDALNRAVELGYNDYDGMKKDPDLAALHGDARFESILEWIYSAFEQMPDCEEF